MGFQRTAHTLANQFTERPELKVYIAVCDQRSHWGHLYGIIVRSILLNIVLFSPRLSTISSMPHAFNAAMLILQLCVRRIPYIASGPLSCE